MLKRTETLAKILRPKLLKRGKSVSKLTIALCLSAASLAPALAVGQDSDAVHAAGLSTVHGKILFQKRSTLVPLNSEWIHSALTAATSFFCDAAGCPQPSTYWALVLQDGQRIYEFHQPFAMGETRAPLSVEIGGVILHSGAEVSLEGDIETISDTYAVIAEVKSVSVISDSHHSADPMLESVWGMEGMEWTCANVEYIGYDVGASVWFGRQRVQDPETFHLRVLARKTNDRIHVQGVTEIGNLQVKQMNQDLLYEGAVDDTAAALAIRRDTRWIRGYPATLRIKMGQGASTAPFPVAGDIHMTCSPSTQPTL